MTVGHGYKANYDYVEVRVERREDHWRLTLKDNRHNESVEHDETFETPAEAQEAALTMAEHHISVAHNDTLMVKGLLSWSEY